MYGTPQPKDAEKQETHVVACVCVVGIRKHVFSLCLCVFLLWLTSESTEGGRPLQPKTTKNDYCYCAEGVNLPNALVTFCQYMEKCLLYMGLAAWLQAFKLSAPLARISGD